MEVYQQWNQQQQSEASDLVVVFKSLLDTINTDAPSITKLSILMRVEAASGEFNVREKMLQIWVSEVERCLNPTKLLALVYLANDVIQLLRRNEQDLIYRYSFAVPFAKSIVAVREKAPELVPKINRIVSIFKNRVIYDSQVLKLLQRVLQDELDMVINNVIPTLKTETSTYLNERLQQLEKESQDKLPLPTLPATRQEATAMSQQRHAKPETTAASTAPLERVSSKVIPPPPLDEIIRANRDLEALCCRPRRLECINLDADSMPSFRGHRVLPNARISSTDSNLIECYKVLLNNHKARVADIQEKIARRKKEEGTGQFLLMVNNAPQSAAASASKRVEVLMKKELSTRLKTIETENAIYWKLVEMLEHFSSRFQRIHSIGQRVETETERRLKAAAQNQEEA